ncbi:coiled-coil domain containing 65 [Perkinsus olseni]|uniref:Coiled-coil domain containing 65 n=2 Tax=Perkinsus olseni TaxID=32597 RepID=A0A7J6SW82_PEROL|nr:coiled-coil domain containing 65 [Perkinsus olseni]
MQMLDRDLDEAEEQHQVAIRSVFADMDTLVDIFKRKLRAQDDTFQRQLRLMKEEFEAERRRLIDQHNKEVSELHTVLEQVDGIEKSREQSDLAEHQNNYEMIRNKNIEEDHQMRSNLEEQIEILKDRCNAQLASYKQATEANTADYKNYLERDRLLSTQVEQKLRQVDRVQNDINDIRQKIDQNRTEWEGRNTQLRQEKENVRKHLAELKKRMRAARAEEHSRMLDLVGNAEDCKRQLKDQLDREERILKLAELCRKFETEREKVLPFYSNADINVDEIEFENEELREEVRDVLEQQKTNAASGCDESTYLDTFFKKYNKIHLDTLAIEQEQKRLETENHQLRDILGQFIDGVTLSPEILAKPNPLLIVNGRVNLNQMGARRAAGAGLLGKPVVQEAQIKFKSP